MQLGGGRCADGPRIPAFPLQARPGGTHEVRCTRVVTLTARGDEKKVVFHLLFSGVQCPLVSSQLFNLLIQVLDLSQSCQPIDDPFSAHWVRRRHTHQLCLEFLNLPLNCFVHPQVGVGHPPRQSTDFAETGLLRLRRCGPPWV